MDDNRLKFGVGVLVIAAIGIGIILTFLFGAVPRVLTGEYKLLVAFPSADGISTNTPVLLRGVEIGRVIDKQLREDDVLLTLGIDTEYRDNLSHEYLPRIGTGSVITGDSKLEFVKATEEQLTSIHQDRLPQIRNQAYTDEQYLSYGQKSSDPFNLMFNLEDELRSTMESIRRAGGSLETVGTNVNQLVADARNVVGQADDELGDVSEEARQALIEFQGAMRNIRELLGDPELKESLRQALAELPDVLNEAQATLQSSQKTFESFEKVGTRFERVGAEAEKTVQNVDRTVDTVRDTVESAQRSFLSAERSIANIEKITEPIAENSENLVRQALVSLANLDRTLRQIETFGEVLNNSDGTVRRLLEDEDLYWQIRRTVENVEQASAKIRPILDDVRVFSDKIARDPRELGIRGALSKRPSGLGLK
ncbi:MCE family protein [Roseiconus nitratireducens]|uniref:MCE family protein n=1 Tax=Roseiconus nitratireducens TaxID=2605748 RepID=A0A5M6DAA2_9BACT|nr:MlaD family protein [Roseiconus nitratireducens]KAA5544303.1 MCE family protein [Roseiconus nitratireducens]